MKCHERFNSFHLEVAILSGQLQWVIENIGETRYDSPHAIIEELTRRLVALVDSADCARDEEVNLVESEEVI